MDLTALLAANPEAQAQYDANIKAHGETQFAAGETAGKKVGKEEMQATITAASPYLANESYPTLGAMALKVLTGEESISTLTVSVTAIDALIEQNKAALAKAEAAGETPATGPTTDAEKAQIDYDAKKKRLGGGV